MDAAPELACMDLGEWYRGLADGASDAARPALLGRAKAYYERFLALHETEDLARNQARLALKKVEADLAKLAAVTETRVVGPGRWVDLLPLVKIEDDLNKKNQKCQWRDDGLWIQGTDFVKVAMPCIPHGDYQLQITFMRPGGTDISAVSVYLPVGPKPVDVSWTNKEHANIGGVKPKPEKGQPGLVLPKQEHTADITVRVRGSLADITVLFDGKPHLHWQGPVTGVSSSWILHEPKRLGFGEAYGNTLLKRYRLRMLSGKALLLRPLRKEAGKGGAAGVRPRRATQRTSDEGQMTSPRRDSSTRPGAPGLARNDSLAAPRGASACRPPQHDSVGATLPSNATTP